MESKDSQNKTKTISVIIISSLANHYHIANEYYGPGIDIDSVTY